jgi:hypothetical protein
MARYETAANIINAAAVECGLTPVSDVYASLDPAFIQLRNLLTSAGREMLSIFQWQKMVKTHSITTAVPPDTGNYDLPDDYAYFIDQTGWSPLSGGTGLPLGGPLSEQDWTYLVNTNLANSTVYVSFKLSQGQFQVLPQPPPDALILNFEYICRNWVSDPASTDNDKDAPVANDDVILYEPILIQKFLKLRFLEAKGFDTTAAVGQFMTMFQSWTGKDIAAPILNMARSRVFPYLGWRNIPETNYGLP